MKYPDACFQKGLEGTQGRVVFPRVFISILFMAARAVVTVVTVVEVGVQVEEG